MWKLVVGLATLVGLATGLASLVGSVVSDKSLHEAWRLALGAMGLVFLAIVPVGCLWVALGPTRLIRGALPQGISNFVMGARVVYGLVAGGFIFLFVSVGFGPEHYESIGPTALACFTFLLLSIVGGQAIDHRRSFHACRDCAMTIKRAARVCPYCGYRYEAPLKGSRGSASPDSGDAGPAH